MPSNAVPYSQRILRALPPSVLKVANSGFLSASSVNLASNFPKSPRRRKRKSGRNNTNNNIAVDASPETGGDNKEETITIADEPTLLSAEGGGGERLGGDVKSEEERERQVDFDTQLAYKIWELATANANPAVDLLVCLERTQEIGFQYVDIHRAVVIHHGSRDSRVPVDNVRWLGKIMRRCEVRVLEGEGHGLMASAAVMGGVLMEVAKEWEDWTKLVQGKQKATTLEDR